MSKVEILIHKTAERYGVTPSIQYFLGNDFSFFSWRVSVDGWHIHSGMASYGSVFADAETIEKALGRLLALPKTKVIREDACRKQCPYYFDDGY